MPPIYIYSDESSDRNRRDGIFSIAGIAISASVWAIRQRLQGVEKSSGKGDKDWHRTKNPKERYQYIRGVLAIPELQGCGFSQLHQYPKNPFDGTAETLAAAIRYFRRGDDSQPCTVIHEGFGSATRRQLQSRLKEMGIRDSRVEAGSMATEPRVRLADALAGFSRLVRSNATTAGYYAGLPYEAWLVTLM